MRRFRRLILALGLIAVALWPTGSASAASGTYHTYLPLTVVESSTFEERVVIAVNWYRAQAGLAPLTMQTPLMNAAAKYTAVMAAADEIGHDVGGTTLGDRITAEGYVWWTCGEDVGAGYTTPEAVVAGWMNSSGHRANILNADFVDVGVGYVYEADSTWHYFWTLDLAAPG